MKDLILVFDQGTTGSAAALFDADSLELRSYHKVEFEQLYPKPGWVEHDPSAIWESSLKALSKCLDQLGGRGATQHICTIGITNQRETVVAWNRRSGELAGNAIVWQDRRTAERCSQLRSDTTLAQSIHQRTGLVIDPYFSATKMEWMLSNYTKAKAWAKSGELVLGTIDSYLIFRLSSGKSFGTEATNASRTLLFNLDTFGYDSDLLKVFRIPMDALAPIQSSAGLFAKTSSVPGLPDGIPISGCIGDQQSALFGQDCRKSGQAKITFGTGAFILMHTGSAIRRSDSGLLTTVAFFAGTERAYALEGSAFIAGAAVQFLRDQFGWFDSAKESESLALSIPRDPHVLFIPALTGFGAPYWNPHAKGALLGFTRGTTRAQITRAVLESIVFQNVQLLTLMQKEGQHALTAVAVDGGATENNFLVQCQADALQLPVTRPHNVQVTARGAAQAARLGMNRSTTPIVNQAIDTITPTLPAQEAHDRVQAWARAAQWVNDFYCA